MSAGSAKLMGGELVGKAADFAAAHRIGLAGQPERAHAGPADAAGRKMAVDDRVDLVGASRRLIHALREQRHHALGRREPVEQGLKLARRNVGHCRGLIDRRRGGSGSRDGFGKARGVGLGPITIAGAGLHEVHEQRGEDRNVRAGPDGKVKIGDFAGRRAARIDDDDPGVTLLLCGRKALVEHRMTPGGIAADEDDEVGLLDVLV
jgi:hypothetical protein